MEFDIKEYFWRSITSEVTQFDYGKGRAQESKFPLHPYLIEEGSRAFPKLIKMG